RPCFYADFMKCQPLNFKGTEGVVSLTRWIEKMESVFQISGCAIKNQVKFATYTMLDTALTWWNSQIRSLGPDAYSRTWEKLRTYAERQTNKRKADDLSRNNHGHQQQPAKRQNVAKVYNIGSGEKKPYEGNLPKDKRAILKGNGCFECGALWHFKRDCLNLKNKDEGNVKAQGWVYAVGNAKKKGNA
nr:reverse transcriptase domain-containing protein [Tanacetum cinerariifolium]